MTVTVNLPTDLEHALAARAVAGGYPLSDAIVDLLRDTVGPGRQTRTTPPVRRLDPGLYPDDEPAEDGTYQAVPLPLVGTAAARFVPAGPLTPAVVPDGE